MTSLNKIIITVAVTLLLFVLAAVVVLFTAGDGHGTYLPALGLFPIPTLTMAVLAMSRGGYPSSAVLIVPVLAFLQFALYGFVIGRAWIKDKTRKAALILGSAHVAILLALAVYFFISQSRR